MSTDPTIRRLDIERDAEALLDMWRASDEQWPGTFSHGAPLTIDWVRDWYEREKALEVLIAELDGQIAGYLSLNLYSREQNVGYGHVLNVHPGYQRQGIARQLLTRMVERCAELGLLRLDLHTWPGNLKAMPLYKKTGFFWMPRTSVWMLNFVPSILQLPLAQDFFQRHNWYTTFQRELDQVEDDEEWAGLHTFCYRWAAEGEHLTVWADRESRSITALETNELLVAAIPESVEPIQGLPTHVRWQISNRGEQPLNVSLIASGSKDLSFEHRATLHVAPGETAEEVTELTIPPEAPLPNKDKPAPAIRSLLAIDGQVLELDSGLRYRPAVTVETIPAHPSLVPGVSQRVHLRLRSHLPQDVRATVRLTIPPGLETDWVEQEVELPAGGYAGLDLQLQSQTAGVLPLSARVAFPWGEDRAETAAKRLAIFCRPPGTVLVDQEKDEVWVENDQAMFCIQSEGGILVVRDTSTGVVVLRLQESLGPPFVPSEFDYKRFQLQVEQAAGQVTVISSASSEDRPGLSLRRRLSFNAGPLLGIAYELVNDGEQAYELQLRQSIRFYEQENGHIALPLQQGLVRAPAFDFPQGHEDCPRRPEQFAERWLSFRSIGLTIGYLWGEDLSELDWGWRVHPYRGPLNCPPGQWTALSGGQLYIGAGGWPTVRRAAQRLAGRGTAPEPLPPQPRPLHSLRLEPDPAITLDDELTATLVLDHLRGRELEGRIRLYPPQGWTVEPAEHSYREVNLGQPFSAKIRIKGPATPGAGSIRAELETPLIHETLELPVLRLGQRGRVEVQQEQLQGRPAWTMDNGRFRFQIAPDFGPSLFGWWEGETNHLLTAFPEAGALSWLAPWFGGIQPVLLPELDSDEWPGTLYREKFAAQAVTVEDEWGIPWQGLRLGADITREEFRGLRLELDFLTLRHAEVLHLVLRIINPSTAERDTNAGWVAFCQVDGEHHRGILWAEGLQRRRTGGMAWPNVGHWVAVSHADTGKTVLLVSPHPHVGITDMAEAGGHLGWLARLRLPAQGQIEQSGFFVLAESLEAAKGYRCLERRESKRQEARSKK